jgi:nucleoside-triphosphatase THEP1
LRDKGKLTLVSGKIRSGKTTFCAAVIQGLEETFCNEWRMKGVLTPAVFKGEMKIAIDAVDINTGQRRRLALRRSERSEGLLTNDWAFDPQVMYWCNQLLRRAVPCDLLVVDELGPLELQRGQGFLEGMAAIDTGAYAIGLVVVREELLPDAKALWPKASTLTIQNPEDAGIAARKFLDMLTAKR